MLEGRFIHFYLETSTQNSVSMVCVLPISFVKTVMAVLSGVRLLRQTIRAVQLVCSR